MSACARGDDVLPAMDATTRPHSAKPAPVVGAPSVVIIVPTFNRAPTLGAAIDSALAQDYADLRLVVVDDGSTDATTAVLDRYRDDPRVTILVRERNGGVMAAKNTGLEALPESCRYFGILDSDDTLQPGAVRALVDAAEASEQPVSQVFGWCADAQSGEPTGFATLRSGVVTYEDALCGRFRGEFWQLVRRDRLSGLRFEERAGGNEAMVWWPMMRRAPALLVDRVVRIYDRSGTDRVNRPAFTAAGALRKMWGYGTLLDRVGADMRAVCPDFYAYLVLERAKWAALGGARGVAWRSVLEAYGAHRSTRALKVAALLLAPAPMMRAAYHRLYRDAR